MKVGEEGEGLLYWNIGEPRLEWSGVSGSGAISLVKGVGSWEVEEDEASLYSRLGSGAIGMYEVAGAYTDRELSISAKGLLERESSSSLANTKLEALRFVLLVFRRSPKSSSSSRNPPDIVNGLICEGERALWVSKGLLRTTSGSLVDCQRAQEFCEESRLPQGSNVPSSQFQQLTV